MSKIILNKYQSACGTLVLGSFDEKLCICDWEGASRYANGLEHLKNALKAETEEGSSETIEHAKVMLDEYFAGKRRDLSLPLLFSGTELQKRVWQELLLVPYGMTTTYGVLARRIGKPNAVRAVANAVGANMISIFVPCHRIVGSDGRLTGYRGGLDAKHFLLSLENNS